MSEQIVRTGRLEPTGLTLQQFLYAKHRLILDHAKAMVDSEPLDVFHNYLNVPYESYIILDDYMWKVVNDKRQDDCDVFVANRNPDGTIDYVLSYYNGGTSFDEVVLYAVEKMTGGTRTAVVLARVFEIPTINMAFPDWDKKLSMILDL